MRGVRFAPSPTGVFHIGNFRTAWISHWWAKFLGEPWVVRFEDIDVPRVVPGAMRSQLDEMGQLGLKPDEVWVQSARGDRHWGVFERAARECRVYPCFCSRREVRQALETSASAPHAAAPVYSGHCRELLKYPPRNAPIAWRFRSKDAAQDFIVARAAAVSERGSLPARSSFAPAYNWACAIDDHDGGYRLLVRAWDLAAVIPQQRAVARMLCEWEGARVLTAAVFHCALVTREGGGRLEKRTAGVTLPEMRARGLSDLEITRCLEKSFDATAFAGETASPGRVFWESFERLSLERLGSAFCARDS